MSNDFRSRSKSTFASTDVIFLIKFNIHAISISIYKVNFLDGNW